MLFFDNHATYREEKIEIFKPSDLTEENKKISGTLTLKTTTLMVNWAT